jgi:hypothetical protein
MCDCKELIENISKALEISNRQFERTFHLHELQSKELKEIRKKTSEGFKVILKILEDLTLIKVEDKEKEAES